MDAGPNAPASPFHIGERAVQARAGVAERMERRAARAIRDFMPELHRSLFPLLPFLPVAIEGEGGWPMATILSGPPGFVSSPDPRRLHVAALPPPADPAAPRFIAGAAVGILGIDLATRRRNRVNGQIASIGAESFDVAVEQSFGNCAQYIQAREFEPAFATHRPGVAWERLGGVDEAARDLIASADTFFVASGSEAGMDMSHRGGRPGFVRVNGDRLTVPDFAGNRYFNTLGNFVLSGKAAVLFPDFSTGDLLHLMGGVEVIWDGEEVRGFQGAERLWRVHVWAGWRGRGALPLRWSAPAYAPTALATGRWGWSAMEASPLDQGASSDTAGGGEVVGRVHVQERVGRREQHAPHPNYFGEAARCVPTGVREKIAPRHGPECHETVHLPGTATARCKIRARRV